MEQKSVRAKLASSQPRSSGGRFAPKAKQEEKASEPQVARPFETPKFLQSTRTLPWGDLIRIGLAVVAVIFFSTASVKHAVCDQGVQTQVGSVKVLKAKQGTDHADALKNLFMQRPPLPKDAERIILYTPKNEAILLLADDNVKLKEYDNKRAFVTAHYNSCQHKMYIPAPENVEALQ